MKVYTFMKYDWRGLVEIQEIWCSSPDGELLWRRENLRNILHLEGEQFILLALFTGGQENAIIPANYFLGLDNRSALGRNDNMSSITGEPAVNGYSRQELSSVSGFTIETAGGNYRASTAVVTFRANGGDWGPIRNLFLTTAPDATGFLISTVNLGSEFSVTAGNTVSMRMAMTLREC